MKNRIDIREFFRSLFTFTKDERRGILWLLPLLAMIAGVIVFSNRPYYEKSFLSLVDKEMGISENAVSNDAPQRHVSVVKTDTVAGELFVFDPNTVSLQELCRLGFSSRTAAGIIKYRERGKRFEIPEDFATCYGVGIGDYTRLEPYIIIGDEFRVKKSVYTDLRYKHNEIHTSESEKLALFDPNVLEIDGFVELGFSYAQAGVIVNYRESMGGFKSADDFAKCYVVSQRQIERLAPYINIALKEGKEVRRDLFSEPLELNTADSASLRMVSGIGDVLVGRIMDYRNRLGGFVRKSQLVEIQGMTEANYERICKQIRVDSCEIRKIDINFANHKTLSEELGDHPYITAKMLRKLLKQRQLKGGWSISGEMVEENIMTRQEADRIAPYLIFRNQ